MNYLLIRKAPGQLVQLKKIYDLSDKNHIGNLQQWEHINWWDKVKIYIIW